MRILNSDPVETGKLRTKTQLIALETGQTTFRLDILTQRRNDIAINASVTCGTFTFIYTSSAETIMYL